MLVLHSYNVCDALVRGINTLREHGVREETRAGSVLVCPWPVVTMTALPQQRVLFDRVRDANPFFHLFEAIWMLAGENDARILDRFVSDFSSRFAESDGLMHGAYGHRWRRAFGLDQLREIVDRIRHDRYTRQCVLQMWNCDNGSDFNPNDEFWIEGEGEGEDDLTGNWKDRPCNTHAYVRVRPTSYGDVLDLTVCCRSNDAVWGAHGSNAVHFSVLQEWFAASVDAQIGTMYQVSNNYHVYENTLKDFELDDRYPMDCQPMFQSAKYALHDAEIFTAWMRMGCPQDVSVCDDMFNSWFTLTAYPMAVAHTHFKEKDHERSLRAAESIQSADWRVACTEWLQRRAASRLARSA